MKIREIINIVDKSKEFEQTVSLSGIAHKHFGINIDIYQEDVERLKSYYIGNWLCTDTCVGYKVYFFDDKPVAVSSQQARKSNENIEWLSKEDYHIVKKYLLSLSEDEEYGFDLADLDEEIRDSYKISYTSQLFPYHKKIATFHEHKVEIIGIADENEMVSKKVVIKYENGNIETLDVHDLDFPYNINR